MDFGRVRYQRIKQFRMISIIISVYQSYEIVRRQLLHYSKINLPFELIIVDDNSNPPIPGATIRTDNKLAWTQGLGRNAGAKIAKGDYFLFTDIDHIISKEAIEDALNFKGNRMAFRRQIAVLDDNGDIRQDRETLKDWGYDKDDLDASVHGNTFVMKREIFEELGGYEPEHSLVGYHPASKKGDDCYFNTKWNRKYPGTPWVMGRDIYMFPIGRYHRNGELNPKGLFHNLDQSKQEKFYKYA